MILRLFHLIRLLTGLSQWTDLISEDCCEKEGFEAHNLFALKSLLKTNPYKMLFLNFATSFLCAAFTVRAFER